MFRLLTMAAALGFVLCSVTSADAATYCASFVGGKEKAGARSQCVFATLNACRASVRHRGGGHCYKMGMGPSTAKK
jgi:hypothetical protein